MFRFFTALFLLMLSCSSKAREVIDHLGHHVTVPDAPQRIVSLQDWTLTVMAHELGAPLIASTGRVSPKGGLYIRGASELFGMSFEKINLAFIHGKPDLERLLALKSDLILSPASDYAQLRDNLSLIAPTLMIKTDAGIPMLKLYADVAYWLNCQQRFDELLHQYQQRVKKLREQLGGGAKTYVVILVNPRDGTIQVLRNYGVLTTVLNDLRMQTLPVASHTIGGADRVTISPELLETIDADYVFTTYLSERGETQQSINQAIETIAPGALQFLKAARNNHLISLPRNEVFSPSFKGLEIMLNKIESVLKPQ
jgi:iron complex transport system substrate-binding protein